MLVVLWWVFYRFWHVEAMCGNFPTDVGIHSVDSCRLIMTAWSVSTVLDILTHRVDLCRLFYRFWHCRMSPFVTTVLRILTPGRSVATVLQILTWGDLRLKFCLRPGVDLSQRSEDSNTFRRCLMSVLQILTLRGDLWQPCYRFWQPSGRQLDTDLWKLNWVDSSTDSDTWSWDLSTVLQILTLSYESICETVLQILTPNRFVATVLWILTRADMWR